MLFTEVVYMCNVCNMCNMCNMCVCMLHVEFYSTQSVAV